MKPVEEGAFENVVQRYHDQETIARDPYKEIDLLAQILSHLPLLKEANVIEGQESTNEEEPPEFFVSFLRELGHGQEDVVEVNGDWDRCEPARDAAQIFITALPRNPSMLQVLKVRSMETSVTCSELSTNSPILSLSALQELDVTFRMLQPALWEEQYSEIKHAGHAAALADALSRASDLRRLRLQGASRFGGPGTYSDGRENLIKFLTQGETAFSSLRSLAVQDTPMDDRYLSTFLHRHQGVLKQLELKNIILVHRQYEQPHECLVAFLRAVRCMRLEEFSLRGLVSNGGAQTWHFEEQFDFPAQLRDFMKGRDEAYKQALNRWACAQPGYGAEVGGRRYPSTQYSCWFDRNAVSVIEKWVLDQNTTRACPMWQFAIRPGHVDFQPALDARKRFSWHAYVWYEEDWDFQYRGEEINA